MSDSWLSNDGTIPARSGGDRDFPLVGNSDDGWEVDEMDGEMEDFTHMPYPAAWDRDPDDDYEAAMVHAAQAWYRAMALVAEQGFAPEDCEAEIMRRCARVSRGQRALERRIANEEAEYGALASDESLCEFPWGRLCPEHGHTLTDTRRGVRCGHEGCERRWPSGHRIGHCDLPAAVVTNSIMKPSGEWRLCAGHREMFPDGPVLLTLPAAAGQSAGTESAEGSS